MLDLSNLFLMIYFRLELQRDTLMKQVFNIEHANAQVESLKASVDAVSLMKNTNVSLKAQMQNFDQDAIESMQDDFADMLDEVGYLQDTVTRSYGVPEDLDEEDLEAGREELPLYTYIFLSF